MVIIVKDFNWRDCGSAIIVNVPLKNISPNNVTLTITEKYIKAYYAPFLFEVFLQDRIIINDSKCLFTDIEMIFHLEKSRDKMDYQWISLEDDTLTKNQKHTLRLEAIEMVMKSQKLEHETKITVRSDIQRDAVKKQLELESKRRETTEQVKQEIKSKASIEVDHIEIKRKPTKPIQSNKTNSKQIEEKKIPPPRTQMIIETSFSERIFPTPSRESNNREENEWLTKQLAAQRATGFVEQDLLPEEKNPLWLKKKGDDFFRQKNYLGAVSAYTHGLKLNDKYISLYVNRSAAHLALNNLHKVLDDCSTAIELIRNENHMTQNNFNSESRARCYARRGAALSLLECPEKAIHEFEAALELKPDDESLLHDYQAVLEACAMKTSS